MNLSNAKSLIIHAADKLSALHREIHNRDLVTTPDHVGLGEINKSLVRAYEHLDLAYESAGCGSESFSEAMEYVELLRKRIAALAEYIRPYRIKNEHISVYSVLNLIYGENQAFNHLASLVNQIEGASHE